MKVKCAICGREFATLITHLRAHGVTTDEYRTKYGGPLFSEEFRQKVTPSDETRRILSETASRTNTRRWQEEREACAKQLDDAREKRDPANFGKSMQVLRQDPEFLAKLHDGVVRGRKERWQTHRDEELEQALQAGKKAGSVWYKGTQFRSKWESLFAEFLDWAELPWLYEPCWFPYYFKGRKHWYCPDFWVGDYWDSYVEIKIGEGWDIESQDEKFESVRSKGQQIYVVRGQQLDVIRRILACR